VRAGREEAMRQIEGVLGKTKKLIASAGTEKDRAVGQAMWEGYLQAFYFTGVISQEDYGDLRRDMEAFRRLDAYRRGMERGETA